MGKFHSNGFPLPSVEDIAEARRNFVAGEPRNLFYLVATELIELASKGLTKVTVAQALAVLLQTWNVSFYRFRGGFREADLAAIQSIVANYLPIVEQYRHRAITGFPETEEGTLRELFGSFENELGPVGAAKCLHLLAPGFFPLWDRAIAKAYRVKLDPNGYIAFMRIAAEQCRELEKQGATWPDLLKALDEFNYCTFTLKLPESLSATVGEGTP